MSELPDCQGPHAALPYRDTPYPATLDDIEQHFVVGAPESTRRRRAVIMQALRLHLQIVGFAAAKLECKPTIWLNGGFTTLKPESPSDVDLVVFVPSHVYPQVITPNRAGLWTLSDVAATLGGVQLKIDKLVSGFGLVDAYATPDIPSERVKWHRRWSSIKGDDQGHKGYIEVVQ